MSIKTSRFVDQHFENKKLTPIYGYWDYPLLPLEQALQPILPLIPQLDRYIKVAKENCTHPSKHNLTVDEAAALYLYTMEWGPESFYRLLNKALRDENRATLVPWFSFLKLFDTTLNKLPSLQKVIWRGVSVNISDQFKDNQEVTWWNVNSCSASVHVVKNFLDKESTLFLIEAEQGKDVSSYTNYPNEDEVLLGPGTRFRVMGNALDHIGGLHVVHLKQITDKNTDEGSTTKICPTEKSTTKNIIEAAYAKLLSVGHVELPKTIKNTVLGRDQCKQNERWNCITYPNGDRYEGGTQDGKKHGQGTYYYINGDSYVGEWRNDAMNGKGTFRWLIGNWYEGNHKDGQMHGHGTFYFANGEKYDGEWCHNMRNGHGTYSWANGDLYTGEHRNNTFHGKGKHVLINGQTRKGTWRNNVYADKIFL